MTARPVPAGYHTATPYLIIGGAAAAMRYYERAFGAVEIIHLPGPDGRIAHAEMRMGDSVIMLADEVLDMGYRSPRSLGGSPVSLLLYVDDVDAVFHRAVAAGALVLRPVVDQFYGDRSGTLEDPFGHLWTIATHMRDVSLEEIARHLREQHLNA